MRNEKDNNKTISGATSGVSAAACRGSASRCRAASSVPMPATCSFPRLLLGDCLDLLPARPPSSVSLILTDLPYGALARSSAAGRWDSPIPLEPLWREFLRVARPNAAIVLFAQGLFSARLMLSQPRLYRYSLVWQKGNPSGFLNANRMPLREHEDILVFYRKLPVFHPQMKPCDPSEVVHSRGRLGKPVTNNCYGHRIELPSKVRLEKCPTSILRFAKPHSRGQHPTQKPVDLLRWLIRSYSDPGDTVLDATMGSGSTGVAAVIEGRRFVGIERDERYFSVASSRISEASSATASLPLASASSASPSAFSTSSLIQQEFALS